MRGKKDHPKEAIKVNWLQYKKGRNVVCLVSLLENIFVFAAYVYGDDTRICSILYTLMGNDGKYYVYVEKRERST